MMLAWIDAAPLRSHEPTQSMFFRYPVCLQAKRGGALGMVPSSRSAWRTRLRRRLMDSSGTYRPVAFIALHASLFELNVHDLRHRG